MKLSQNSPKKMQYNLDGWAKNYLNTMLNGLTGHLDSLFYPFNTNCWAKATFVEGGLEGWWPYEQYSYWLDGLIKCSYFANDKENFNKAKNIIDNALEVVDENGFIGAKELKVQGQGNQWVHAVFFRAVLFLYEITGDKKYLNKTINHYLSNTSDYSLWRESVNIENIVNCYLSSGKEELKTLAINAYELHCSKDSNIETKMQDYYLDKPINLHAVTYNEMVKIPALLYCLTEDYKYLEASIKGVERIHKYHMLPIGIHSGAESFNGTDSLSCVETCDISDYCWTLSYLAEITNDNSYLDEIERIMLNVAPGIMDHEFKTLQYFSSMNQVISTFNSNHSTSFTQTPRMAYQSDHYPECCTGNANRSMPNYIYRAISKKEYGYKINFYIPGHFIMDDLDILIETNYPYSENVKIIINSDLKNKELHFRIPKWCVDFKYQTNHICKIINNELIVSGDFKTNEEIVLEIPSKLEVVETSEGYLVQKQPIVYTLKINEDIQIDTSEKRQAPGYPAYNISPASIWNIGLNKELFLSSAQLINVKTNNLFDNGNYITASGYILNDLSLEKTHTSLVPISDYDKGEIVKLRRNGQFIYEGDLLFTPSIKDKKFNNVTRTNITLVPYSVAMLRWTIFPKIK